jgi:phage terminase large subunit-like protein
VPEGKTSAGADAVELAELAGLHLDPWQRWVLEQSLGEGEDGKWAAFEVGLVLSRQCGKGAVLEARELAGLFLLGERLLVHSAHQAATSGEHFRRLIDRIESTPEFDRRVRKVSYSHGDEGIDLKSGQRIRFRTRTSGGARGFSADCVVFDEAMEIPEAAHAALLPTLSARPNPQVWYAGSAVDKRIHPNGVVLARVRERGLAGDDDSLAYFEWSIPQHPDTVTDSIASDREAWAQTNPALGIRVSTEHVANERAALSLRTFAVERLGAGDWPDPSEKPDRVIDPEAWEACLDPDSCLLDPVRALAFDLTPDRTTVTIAAAGKNDDDLWHIELLTHKRGTRWLGDALAKLVEQYECKVYTDAYAPAGSLIPELERAGVEVVGLAYGEVAQACGIFYDAVVDRQLRHLGNEDLTTAVVGAAKKPLGDRFAWDRRRSSAADITPLVACTFALWGAQQWEPSGVGIWSISEVIEEMKARQGIATGPTAPPPPPMRRAAPFLIGRRDEPTFIPPTSLGGP